MHRKVIKLLYKNILKNIFFLFDPEYVHDLLTMVGKVLGRFSILRKFTSIIFSYNNDILTQTVKNIKFKNPVGLSAGFDKDANLINILPSVGFGFGTIGSITYESYIGNPKPRLYRLKKSKALVVYYGLKNIGVKNIIPKILKSKKIVNEFPVCISVAKTNCERTKSEDKGIEDYFLCFSELLKQDIGDLYEINISCPNTFGGEPFTTPTKLKKLLFKINSLNIIKPVFIKMPINLEWSDFKALLDVIVEFKYISGVTIGNLNKDYSDSLIKDNIPKHIKGGISGKPTINLSNSLISKTYMEYGDKLIIKGVGGIFNALDAYEKIKRGSTLIELITGMIYEGPQLIGEINKGLVELLKRDGYTSIREAVGSYRDE